MLTCYSCGKDSGYQASQNIHRTDRCEQCYADLRCCRMCKFYDKTSYNECKEPVADRITDKEKANFCDFFQIGGQSGASNPKEDLLAKANALFKK